MHSHHHHHHSFHAGILAGALLLGSATAQQQVSQIQQNGITWAFAQPVVAGQFVNGDRWVQAPATVASVSPAPGGGRNGSMLNPKSGVTGRATVGQAYDSRINYYNAGSAVAFPVALRAGDALISSISGSPPQRTPYRNISSTASLKTAAVLSCVASPPPAGSFRPPYCGPKVLRNESSIRWNILPRVARVASSPDPNVVATYFQKVWLDHIVGWVSRDLHPYDNMPDYGRDMALLVGEGGLLLLENRSQSELRNLMINYLQLGIDLYGLLQDGHEWWAEGGHMVGRKWPIMFAGYMFNDAGMMSPGSSKFSEDLQTYFGPGWEGSRALFRQWSNSSHEERHPSTWNSNEISEEKYRRCCTSAAWVGEALCAHIMRATAAWGYPAFFEYTERWMTLQWPADVTATAGAIGQNQVNWFPHEDTLGSSYIAEMWWTYRHNYLPQGVTEKGGRSQYPIRIALFDGALPGQSVDLGMSNAPMTYGVCMMAPTMAPRPMRFLNATYMLGQAPPPIAIGFQADSHGKAVVTLKLPPYTGISFGVQMGWLDGFTPAAETSDAFLLSQ